MPIINTGQTYLNKRFDFGVPLEDISPPDDIHPRLKHLFHQTIKHYILNNTDIEHTLKDFQGSLEDRFHLKEQLIFQIPCSISNYELPGSYFWLIRHFLGLLPIPLLPSYYNKVTYDWENLGKKCQMVLSHDKFDVNLKFKVNNCIARCLDTLPAEHFLLLTALVNFIRKIAFAFGVLHKRNFVYLAKYYCGSVFIRPYRPGHREDGKIFPLFIYILTKWNNITKKCERHVKHIEIIREYLPIYQLQKNAYCQVNFMNENYNNVVEKLLSNSLSKTYISDACCQTELPIIIPKKSCGTNMSCQTEVTETTNTYCQTDTNFEDLESILPIANSSVIENHCSGNYYTALFTDPSLQLENEDETNSKVDFSCSLDSNNHAGWNDVMRETEKTVKKVEEYIYDDYETFRWEDYNQISNERKSFSTFKDNRKQTVWTDYTPRSLIYRESNDENESISAMISNKTYFKFPDVVCDDVSEFSSSGHSTAPSTVRLSAQTSKSCNHMNKFLASTENKPEEAIQEKPKINFSLKRFKMSLHFLRGFIPKKNYRTTYRDMASNVSYKKIYNKASTL